MKTLRHCFFAASAFVRLPLSIASSRRLAAILGFMLLAVLAQAATVQHLNTQTATASGAGASGTPSITSFNIPAGKNRVLFIWAAFERDHCSPADVTGGLATNANVAGTGLGDNYPEPRVGTPPSTTTNNQLTARVVGTGGTINKQNALVIGGTPSGDTRFLNIAKSPTGAPSGAALFGMHSFHVVLFESEINALLGGASSGSVAITLPDTSTPSNAGDESFLTASVLQNVEQTVSGIVRNATATAQVTTGTPGNFSLSPAAYDAGQAPNEADDGKLVLGISSSTEGFTTPSGHVALATLSVTNAGGQWDTADGNVNNEPNGSSVAMYFSNGGVTPGALYTLTAAGAAGTLVFGGMSPSFLLESDNADTSDAPASYGNSTHTVTGIRLGATVDADASSLNNSTATGDDTNNADDEDGVTIPAAFLRGLTQTVPVSIQNASGFLSGWIDWNADGDFDDAGEQIVTAQAVAVGTVNLSVSVPAGATAGPSFARFRVSTNNTALDNSNVPVSTVQSGEVEDYAVVIAAPSSNADLSALTVNTATLNESFSAATTSYTSSVPNTTASVTVTPTASQGNATIEVRVGADPFASVSSGGTSSALPLSVGVNTIQVRVTAQDGTTIQTYTITVTRASGSGTWTALGPAPATGGQVEGIADRPVVGAVHAVLPHPTNPDVLYVGAVNGGVWKTTNATSSSPTWTPLTDAMPSLSIGALTFDLADPTFNTLYAGIGNYSSFGRVGGTRTGLIRSTDGGLSWQVVNGGGTLTGKNISGLYANGTTIVVSVNVADSFTFSNVGLFRSTNGGTSFTQISTGTGATTGLPGGVCYDLVFDPVTPATLYTSTTFSDLVGGVNGVYKSTDAGATWVRVSTPTMGVLITNNTSNLELAVGRSNEVYAAIINSGSLAGLFRSPDSGATWTQMDLPKTNENGTDIGLNPGGQGSIHFSIVADPTNANIVYVGGDRQPRSFGDTGSYPNSIGASDATGRLFRGDASKPAGSQFAHLTHSNTLGAVGGGTAGNSAPRANSRDMMFDASGNLIEVDDGGVYRRTSPRTNTGDWLSMIGNLSVTEVHDAAWDSLSNVAITGNQSAGTTYQPSENTAQWATLSTGDGGDVAVDNLHLAGSNQSVRYSSFQNLGAFRRMVWDATGGLVSTTFPSLTLTGGGTAISPAFRTPIETNSVAGNRLLIQGSNGLYESLDGGSTITAIGASLGANSISASALSYGGMQNNVANPDLVWAASASNVYVRTSGTGNVVATVADPTTAEIRDLAVNSRDWANAFIVVSNKVYQTTNVGASWSEVTGNLMSLAGDLRSIAFVPGSGTSAIVVGTNAGVFASSSASLGTWVRVGSGLPNVLVYDLDYDATDDVLLAGTLGRGAWHFGNAQSITLTTAPEIAVSETGVSDIPDNTGTFSFGTTTVGTPVTKTFTVTNSGTAALNLSALSVPSGFSIANNFGSSTVVASGGTTTFQITMTATAAGAPSGTLTFDTNDSNENPFNYTINGTVNSNNADLATLSTSAGSITFSAATTGYAVNVPNGTATTTVTAARADANATLEVRVNSGSYAPLTSGVESGSLALNVGTNSIDVKVTAQDGATSKTYTITVTRAPAPLAEIAVEGNATNIGDGAAPPAPRIIPTSGARQWRAARWSAPSPSKTPVQVLSTSPARPKWSSAARTRQTSR